MVAVGFGEAAQKFGRPGWAALVVMLALVVPSNLLVTNEYYRLMLRNGGSLVWTDAIYPLSDFLKSVSATQVTPIDWGILDSLKLLHDGKLPLRNGMDPLAKRALNAADQQVVRELLNTPGTVFISHTDANEQFPGVNGRLEAVARDCGLEKDSLAILADRHGRQIFEVFRYK